MAGQNESRWDELLAEAFTIIDKVNQEFIILDDWSFGGGTAMMLQIEHRESHDIDLFLNDPQILRYVTSAVENLRFDIGEPTYTGDGVSHLKISFESIGEIDFIVTPSITDEPTLKKNLLSRPVKLETLMEIIAKKIRYRGSMIQPRDVFDIAAACVSGYEEEIRVTLSNIPEQKQIAFEKLNKLNEEYINGVISQLMIRDDFKDMAKDSISIVKDILR